MPHVEIVNPLLPAKSASTTPEISWLLCRVRGTGCTERVAARRSAHRAKVAAVPKGRKLNGHYLRQVTMLSRDQTVSLQRNARLCGDIARASGRSAHRRSDRSAELSVERSRVRVTIRFRRCGAIKDCCKGIACCFSFQVVRSSLFIERRAGGVSSDSDGRAGVKCSPMRERNLGGVWDWQGPEAKVSTDGRRSS